MRWSGLEGELMTGAHNSALLTRPNIHGSLRLGSNKNNVVIIINKIEAIVYLSTEVSDQTQTKK